MPKLTLPSGHTWAFVDANPTAQTTLLCLHGFPDLAYGYRLQIGPWARAGFRVVVPDMLGYGGSDAPTDPSNYTTKRLADDLAALLTALGVDRAVIIGHSWGSFTASRLALWHPKRVITLILMTVAHTHPVPQRVTLEDVVKRVPNFGYQLFLASPESPSIIEANLPAFIALIFAPTFRLALWHPKRVIALILMTVAHTPPVPQRVTLEDVVKRIPNFGYQLFLASPESPSIIEANLPAFIALIFAPTLSGINFTYKDKLRKLLASPNLPKSTLASCILKGDVLRAYTAAFKARGMTGPTNYYRTTTLRFDEEAAASPPLALPRELQVLFVYGVADPTLVGPALKTQRKVISKVEETQIANTGHWVLFEHSPFSEEPPVFLEEGTPEDPLAGWRERTSAGAWKDGHCDGGPAGRTIIQFLANLGIEGRPAKL
uniref:Epoxide hydrolase hydrolase n=1 Tax=Mycena chlorophos TaxID=658473 RepID=A0ABQ0LSC5_MYCCL|nr:epoxide hydrolase hydrolase [Mycena chlorophos]